MKPGDEYRLWFTTSTTRDGTSSNIQDYNDFVQARADAAPIIGELGLEWKAVASSPDVDARDNADMPLRSPIPGVPVYLVNGELFATDDHSIWGGVHLGGPFPVITELGTTLPVTIPGPNSGPWGPVVWTGTREAGDGFGPLGGPNISAIVGYARQHQQLFGAGTRPLTSQHPFYAISETITAVPEPSSLALLGLALCGLGALRKRR